MLVVCSSSALASTSSLLCQELKGDEEAKEGGGGRRRRRPLAGLLPVPNKANIVVLLSLVPHGCLLLRKGKRKAQAAQRRSTRDILRSRRALRGRLDYGRALLLLLLYGSPFSSQKCHANRNLQLDYSLGGRNSSAIELLSFLCATQNNAQILHSFERNDKYSRAIQTVTIKT